MPTCYHCFTADGTALSQAGAWSLELTHLHVGLEALCQCPPHGAQLDCACHGVDDNDVSVPELYA